MKFADLLKENVSSSLTTAATVTLTGAPAGFRTLADVLADGDFVIGDKTTFKIMDEQGNWEFSTFQITNATTLTRVTIHRSSNIDNLVVTFPTGPKTIFNSPGGEWLSSLVSSLDPVETTIADLTTRFVPMVGPSGTSQISVADLANAIGKEPSTLPSLESAFLDSDELLVLRSGELKRGLASAFKSYNGGTAPADTSKPTLSSAQVANAAPTKIVLTFSETLGAWTPAAAAFAASGGKTVTLVERSGATITLTVSTAYVYGDAITVTYTKPGSNALQDAAGNQVDSFGPSAVTNNVAQTVDSVKPAASSAAVANASPSLVVITMSEPMDGAYDPAASAFTVSGHTVSAVDVTGSVINLTVTPAFVNGEAARTVSYTQPGTNQARDVAGNLLDTFASLAITNNVAAAGETVKPTATAAAVANATPTVVNITMSEPMDGSFDPATSSFTVSGHTVSAVDVAGSAINITVTPAFVNGEAARTVSYTPPGTNNARDVAGNTLDAFTNLAITNNVAAAAAQTFHFGGAYTYPDPISYGANGYVGTGRHLYLYTGDTGNTGFQTLMSSYDFWITVIPVSAARDASGLLPVTPPTTTDTLHSRSVNTWCLCSNNGTNGLLMNSNWFAYKLDYPTLPQDLYFYVKAVAKGAGADAAPVWHQLYDGNDTGTPVKVTMTA